MAGRRTLLLLGLLSLLGSGAFSSPLWAQSYSRLQLDGKRIPWTFLSFQAKSFWVDLTTDVRLTPQSAESVQAELLENKRGDAVAIPAAGAYKLTNHTLVDSTFQRPVKIADQVWFDPRNAAALGRVQLRQGQDDFKKICRFTSQGVFRHRIEPKDKQEARQDPEQWTDVRDTFYAYDMDALGCPYVSEPLLLIYIASAVDQWDNTNPLSFCIFGKRQLFNVQLKSAGLQTVKINFTEKKQQTENHRQGEVNAQKIVLSAQPLKSDLNEVENFSFLGLHKEIAFFRDPASRLPVQVVGEIPTVGGVALKLHDVQLR